MRVRRAFPAGSSARPRRRFNGAALLRVRRVARSSCKTCSSERLQRGRTLASAESRPAPRRTAMSRPASTGPHSCECGEQHFGHLGHRIDPRASTGPHSCECGEPACRKTPRLPTPRLQRGRTLASAESSPRLIDNYCSAVASTGPHSCECGEIAARSDPHRRAAASTGPHSCECGEKDR